MKTFSVYGDPMLDKLGISKTVGHEPLPDSLDALRESKEIYFVKTHECASDDNPAIFLIRDGRDALVSHAKYQLSFRRKQSIFPSRRRRDFEHTLEKLICAKPQFGGWSDNALSWVDRPAARTAVVSFESLIVSPQAEAEKALAQLGLDLREVAGSKIPNFAALHKQNSAFFRKGKVGAWRDEMPEHLQELFWHQHGPTMERFGYGGTHAPDAAVAKAI